MGDSGPRTLAVDVGGTGLKAVVLDPEGEMISERVRVETPYPCPPPVLLDELDKLAKTQPEYVSLEFDEQGQSFYLFSRAGTRPHPFGAKYRVGAEGRVRVADVLGVDGPRQTLDEQTAQRRNSN